MRRESAQRSFPARDGDARAVAGLRLDLEFVRQALGAAQAEAQAAAGGVAVLHRQLDVGDARARVEEHQLQPLARAVRHGSMQRDLAAAAVVERVARELARGGDDLGLVDQR